MRATACSIAAAVGLAGDLAGQQHRAAVADGVDMAAIADDFAHARRGLRLDGLVLELGARGAAVGRHHRGHRRAADHDRARSHPASRRPSAGSSAWRSSESACRCFMSVPVLPRAASPPRRTGSAGRAGGLRECVPHGRAAPRCGRRFRSAGSARPPPSRPVSATTVMSLACAASTIAASTAPGAAGAERQQHVAGRAEGPHLRLRWPTAIAASPGRSRSKRPTISARHAAPAPRPRRRRRA